VKELVGIAVLGFGIVGSGVVEIIRKNSENINNKAGDEIRLKYILDIRDFPNHSESAIMTKNADEVFNDSEVKIIIETIGGIKIAYEYTKRALLSGKHVVTSNKELVATHGPELLQIAKENNLNYMYEASVGGGIPIIKPLYECLTADEITSITGILNGTTNYILTSMCKGGKTFETALKDAQNSGYAEANPVADIEGHDSCRKLAILSSIAYGQYVNYKNIPVEGITKLTYEDLKVASAINHKIKLIAYSKKIDDKIFARVCPVMLDASHILANVEDVYNAILVSGNAIGEVMFYGKGAGKLPTASAVVGDIIGVCKNINRSFRYIWNISKVESLSNPDFMESQYFIRINVRDIDEAKKYITESFINAELFEIQGEKDKLGFKTGKAANKDIQQKIQKMKETGSINEVLTTIITL
jgi:homoserine dehydrogenase